MEQLADTAVYSERVIALFEAPPNAGTPVGANLAGEAISRSRDARVRLDLCVRDGRIAAAGFSALGCPHVIAAAVLVAQDLEGRGSGELAGYEAGFLGAELPLPAEKLDIRILLEDAVRDAARRAAGGD